jgi:precorrin-8X/cobalt-precorrin-8 methylmutase
MQTEKGQSIEDASMQVIESEIGEHSFSNDEWNIVRRIIHSTADFDFARANSIIFHKNAIDSGISALRNGCSIIVDVNGVSGLLNKKNLSDYKNKIVCKISDPETVKMAESEKKTRSQVSMRLSREEMNGGIIVIGNAPTALLEVIEMVKEGIVKPALIIGIPVGFISAAESKEILEKLDVPYITNRGRKGGSPSAAAIVNALFKILKSRSSS